VEQRTVWASALQPPYTGVGVFQRELNKGLMQRGIGVFCPEESQNRAIRPFQSFVRVIGPSYAAALVCTTPAPLVIRVPIITFVYDLRWRNTRGPGARLYRYLNLRRTVANSDHIFVDSRHIRDELVDLFPSASSKSSVLHLGPGIVSAADFAEGEPGTVLLIGKADYKRNELVSEALAMARPDWVTHFLCVGVSDAAFQTLVDAFGQATCERFNNVDDDTMRGIFRRASVYITASTEEGFGLPMVEALTAGCQVIAVRQPLTIEIMAGAAVLIDNGDSEDIAHQLRRPQWISLGTRLAQAAMFSWDAVAETVAMVIDRLTR
jgi:mannosyltransferase